MSNEVDCRSLGILYLLATSFHSVCTLSFILLHRALLVEPRQQSCFVEISF